MRITITIPQNSYHPEMQSIEQEMQRRLIAVLREVTEELEEWQIGAPCDREEQTQAIIKRARAALAAAGGAEQPANPMPGLTRFDGYEIAPVHREEGTCEICAPAQAHFWTLYGHIPGEGVEAIADLKSREACEELLYRITGSVEYFYNACAEEERTSAKV